jgi:ADP-ribose pyrophosphatase YjhB (NUDIX family)
MRYRATAVVIRNGKLLLVRDKGHAKFSLPGGGIEKDEPTIGAVARELREELGLNATKVDRIRHCDFKGSFSQHKVCLVEASGEPHLRGHELSEFMWWDMKKDIPMYSHVRQILNKI